MNSARNHNNYTHQSHESNQAKRFQRNFLHNVIFPRPKLPLINKCYNMFTSVGSKYRGKNIYFILWTKALAMNILSSFDEHLWTRFHVIHDHSIWKNFSKHNDNINIVISWVKYAKRNLEDQWTFSEISLSDNNILVKLCLELVVSYKSECNMNKLKAILNQQPLLFAFRCCVEISLHMCITAIWHNYEILCNYVVFLKEIRKKKE